MAAEDALAVFLYCALCAPTLEAALLLAVNHGGDSDSTGAIAGQIAGALYGEEAIPARCGREGSAAGRALTVDVDALPSDLLSRAA